MKVAVFLVSCVFILGCISGWNSRVKEVKKLKKEKASALEQVEFLEAKIDAYKENV